MNGRSMAGKNIAADDDNDYEYLYILALGLHAVGGRCNEPTASIK
jgi:hypothetical protein